MEWDKNPKNPFFSVVITTYNRAGLVVRALNSLINQQEKDWEASILDDGSVDNTAELLQPFLKKYPCISYHFQPNRGPNLAKNAGIKFTAGQYVTFLDSDDEYLPNHLISRKAILLQQPAIDFLEGGVKVIGDKFVPDKNNRQKKIQLSKCAIGGTFFIKRAIILRLKGFKNIPMGSDADLLERAKESGITVATTTIPSYIYHHEILDSVTHNYHA